MRSFLVQGCTDRGSTILGFTVWGLRISKTGFAQWDQFRMNIFSSIASWFYCLWGPSIHDITWFRCYQMDTLIRLVGGWSVQGSNRRWGKGRFGQDVYKSAVGKVPLNPLTCWFLKRKHLGKMQQCCMIKFADTAVIMWRRHLVHFFSRGPSAGNCNWGLSQAKPTDRDSWIYNPAVCVDEHVYVQM